MTTVFEAVAQTFNDVVRISRKPVIASHSSVWKICPNRRNLKDKQIEAIAATGGAVFVNFAPFFIDSTYTRKENDLERMRTRDEEQIRLLSPGKRTADSLQSLQKYREKSDSIRPPLSLLIDHIVYIANLVGSDHVGLGSDFDGIHVTPRGMDDVTFLPAITKELLQRGFPVADVRKILGGNLLRILAENEGNP